MASFGIDEWSAKKLYDFFSSKALEIPWFQRTVVWSPDSKKKFINTLKRGWPFGALLVYKHPGKEKYSIVDGLQRTSTIKDYFDRPTEYFVKEDVPSANVDEIASVLNIAGDEVRTLIIEWVKEQKLSAMEIAEESSTKGFDALGLVNFLKEKIPNFQEVHPDHEKKIEQALRKMVDAVRKAININEKIIPVIEFSIEEGMLSEVFKLLNREGQPLSVTDVLAATWDHSPVGFNDDKVFEKIKKRYEQFKDLGFEVQLTDDERKTFFLYLYGLGKVVIERYPTLFKADTRKRDNIVLDDIAFKLFCYCKKLDITELGKLPDLMFQGLTADDVKKKGVIVDAISNRLDIAIQNVSSPLAPFIEAKLNQIKGGAFVPPHADYLMVAMIAKMYLLLEEDEKLKRKKKDSLASHYKYNIPGRYFYEIINGRWSGSGNTRAKEVVDQTSTEFISLIEEAQWNKAFVDWYVEMFQKEERERTNIPAAVRLFLRYVYSDIMTVLSDRGMKEFHIEHLIPVERLKMLVKHFPKGGLPISHPANLAILPKTINIEKQGQTIYEYFSGLKINDKKRVSLIEEAEKYTLTDKEDLAFVKELNDETKADDAPRLKEKYFEFLRRRQLKMTKLFLENINK